MNQSHFRQLLDSYITGTITGDEQRELFQLLEQDEYKALLEGILQQEWEQGTYEEPANDQIASLVESYVMNKIQPEAKVRRLPFFYRYRIAVAAAALLIVLAGSYFIFLTKTDQPSKEQVAEVMAPVNDAEPGKYKAKLTISNGTSIVLDSAGAGELVKQGNVRVMNKDGQLVYESVNGSAGQEMVYNTLTTARGEIYSTVLADGSKIWLNSASSVKYPVAFNGKERVIEVTGEAYLEIAAVNDKRGQRVPFIVKTDKQEIAVLGTHFNVNAYEDEVATRTTLLEGLVSVSSGDRSVLIKPGQQSILLNGFTVKEVNVQDVVAWKDGFFSYRSTDIKGVMRQLSRWYDVDVVYEGVNPEQTFTGKIDRNLALSEVLKILEKTKAHFKIDGKKLIILP